MAKEYNETDLHVETHGSSRVQKQELERSERDYELFLQELEEDEELRKNVNMYKVTEVENFNTVEGEEDDGADESSELEESDAPVIGVDELLDELDDLTLEDQVRVKSQREQEVGSITEEQLNKKI